MVKASLVQALSLAHAETLVNHALQYSIEWPEYASLLNGKVICCTILPPQQKIFCTIQNNQISLKAHGPETPDLTLTAPLSAFLELLQTKRAGNRIHLTGDAHLAQTLQQAMASLDIDWEALLADKIGEIPARQTSEVMHRIKSFAHRFFSRSLSQTADYLVDEKKLLASQPEVEVFSQEVTALRYAVDRFEARLRRLEGKYAE